MRGRTAIASIMLCTALILAVAANLGAEQIQSRPIPIPSAQQGAQPAESSERGCYWLEYNLAGTHVLDNPTNVGRIYHNMRFSPEVGCTLKTIEFAFHTATGTTAGAEVCIWKSDGFYPTSVVSVIAIDTVDEFFPNYESIDVSGLGLVPNGDFHVGCAALREGDTLWHVMDNGSGAESRAMVWEHGIGWRHVPTVWGNNHNFLIRAEMCCPDYGEGDVYVTFNGGQRVPFYGDTNIVELWIKNDTPLAGMDIAFEFDIDVAYEFISDYGAFGYVNPEGDAVGAFDLYHDEAVSIDGNSPDSIRIGAVAMLNDLPAHSTHSLCYTMAVVLADGDDPLTDGLCVDNIIWPGGGIWSFNRDDATNYAPDFQGNPNSGVYSPDAPPACFDLVKEVRGRVVLNTIYPSPFEIGDTSRLDIVIWNDEPLTYVSLPLEFDIGRDYQFLSDHGVFGYVEIHDDAIGPFDFYHGQLNNIDDVSPDSVLIRGSASSLADAFPAHTEFSHYFYTLGFFLPWDQADSVDGVCADNILYPPAGSWTFVDKYGSYAPRFIQEPNSGEMNPDAPEDCGGIRQNDVRGDVEVHLNGGLDVAYVGAKNIVEIWVQNWYGLYELGLGFDFAIGRDFQLDPTYGTLGYLNPEGDAISSFEQYQSVHDSHLDGVSSDSIGWSMLAYNDTLPPHPEHSLCYTLAVDIFPHQSPLAEGFSVDNIALWSWNFYDSYPYGGNYPPRFQGVENLSDHDLDAPPVVFDIVEQRGDVEIHLNGGQDVAFIGETNIVEIWIRNQEPLYKMSIPFEFSIGRNYQFVYPHGTFGYSNPEGDAVGTFDLFHGEFAYIDDSSPDTVMIGGLSLSSPRFPAHLTHSLCYTMAVEILSGEDPLKDGFCVDNVFMQPPAPWEFDEGAGGQSYPPAFNGYVGFDQDDPIAPPICFDIIQRPRGDVEIHLNGGADVAYVGQTNTVEIWIQNDNPLTGLALPLEFAIGRDYQFDPAHGTLGYANPEGDAVGSFDLVHLEFPLMDDVSPDTISVEGICMFNQFPAHPTHSLCYTMSFQMPAGQEALANGLCVDNIYWSTKGIHPWFFGDASGNFAPSFNGEFSVDEYNPTAPPICFDIVAIAYTCGDADGNEIVNISDAVYLITYIFGGGPEPDPLLSGDCDCNQIVNISDAVFLIAYIFGGGPEPCDTNDDGVPDC